MGLKAIAHVNIQKIIEEIDGSGVEYVKLGPGHLQGLWGS